MGKCCLHTSSFIFDRTIIKVAGNQDKHNSSVEFDFGPNQTTHELLVTKISHLNFNIADASWPILIKFYV